jgi:hypothetical protein
LSLSTGENIMQTSHNTFGKGLSNRAVNGGSDDYFTRPAVASSLVGSIAPILRNFSTVVEPSAGAGSFVDALISEGLNVRAFDLCPRRSDITKRDFFTLSGRGLQGSAVVGNPPFGFAANLAVDFFNHAATFADLIAFVVPRSFEKTSITRRLNPLFHLVESRIMSTEECTFDASGSPKVVPCVWQVWARTTTPRDVSPEPITNPWIEFTSPALASHAIRRVGGRAGRVLDGLNHSTSSTYFVRELTPGAVKAIASADFSSVVNSTAGVRSISKRELVAYLSGVFHA